MLTERWVGCRGCELPYTLTGQNGYRRTPYEEESLLPPLHHHFFGSTALSQHRIYGVRKMSLIWRSSRESLSIISTLHTVFFSIWQEEWISGLCLTCPPHTYKIVRDSFTCTTHYDTSKHTVKRLCYLAYNSHSWRKLASHWATIVKCKVCLQTNNIPVQPENTNLNSREYQS